MLDIRAMTIHYLYYKNVFGGLEWPNRWDKVLGPVHPAFSMRVASLKPLYAPLQLLLPWISYMLISQVLRLHWSQINHLELPTSWFSKTTSQNTCWCTWPYISIFGAPARLLSNRDASFTSNVIEELCKILGIKQLQTMPYHPQTNGLVERL